MGANGTRQSTGTKGTQTTILSTLHSSPHPNSNPTLSLALALTLREGHGDGVNHPGFITLFRQDFQVQCCHQAWTSTLKESTPPPLVIATPKYGINTVPTPTVAITRAWLAHDTYNYRHTRERMHGMSAP